MSNQEVVRVGSRLRWEDVTLPTTINAADLDALIFSTVTSDWQKMSMIVGSVGLTCQIRSIPVGFAIIAARIQCLAEAGLIESRGDLSTWRRTEIRLRD